MHSNAEAVSMERNPAVTCSSCGFAWNSAVMAEGLRLLGSCPKCSGELVFRADEAPAEPVSAPASVERSGGVAPHLVLGLPRR